MKPVIIIIIIVHSVDDSIYVRPQPSHSDYFSAISVNGERMHDSQKSADSSTDSYFELSDDDFDKIDSGYIQPKDCKNFSCE